MWSSCVSVPSPRELGVVFMCICPLPQGVGCGLHVYLYPPPGCWVWSSCVSVPSPGCWVWSSCVSVPSPGCWVWSSCVSVSSLRVLGVVVDIEILLGLTKSCRDDTEAKLYAYLMQFLQKNLLRAKLPPLVGDGLTPPPFEKPSIKEVRVKFVSHDGGL